MKRFLVQTAVAICGLWCFPTLSFSQAAPADTSASESSTSTDLFIMLGSDFVRPGLGTRANYNIGLGHTYGFLKKDPLGDEVTFAYTYENAGSHGFFHTSFGSHTEALGIMKNFALPRTKNLTGYTWIQLGLTSITGNTFVQNRLYDGESAGLIVHFNDHHSIWIQETFNKVAPSPVIQLPASAIREAGSSARGMGAPQV